MSNNATPFPKDFVWGAATASYQIEGAIHEDGRGVSIWDTFSATPGKIVNGDTGAVACDHYHRWEGDIALMRQLGLKAYRFSIAWPRILPQGRGQVNEAGLDFYEKLVDGLLAAGITPWVTLYHWDLPQALEDEGGWLNRATSEAFAEYTEVVTKRLGGKVKNWITFNEPWCSCVLGYHNGIHAPGRVSHTVADSLTALHTTYLAHGKAMAIIRRNSPGAKAGITLNLSQVYPASDSEADKAAAWRHDGYQNRWYLDPLYGRGYPADMLAIYGDLAPQVQPGDFELMAAETDFLGLNYYAPTYIGDGTEGGDPLLKTRWVRREELAVTAMDWSIYPDGLYDQIMRVSRDYPVKEVYVTENGAAYDDAAPTGDAVHDELRVAYYQQHIAAAGRSIADGAPFKGYFAWSLMDNYEWAFGYTKRFGIIYVDYETQKRTIKDSGLWYRDFIAANTGKDA
ncbi:beta-glucosidase [Chloroflexia bacterium SDU3-3]|nr:beta-glucosidase [Chloroflexia bacterium SDU3-3]